MPVLCLLMGHGWIISDDREETDTLCGMAGGPELLGPINDGMIPPPLPDPSNALGSTRRLGEAGGSLSPMAALAATAAAAARAVMRRIGRSRYREVLSPG